MKVTQATIKRLLASMDEQLNLILQIAKDSKIDVEDFYIKRKTVINSFPPDIITFEIQRYFDLSLKTPGRQAEKVRARQITCYLMHKHSTLTLDEIKTFTTIGDHTTVIYNIKEAKRRIAADLDYARDVIDITMLINLSIKNDEDEKEKI